MAMDNHVVTIVKHLELSTFKYISDYRLIYVKISKSSKCLDILQMDA